MISTHDTQLATGVAILSDPDTDPQLAALFDRRRKLTDAEFLADWGIGAAGFRAFVRPDAPDALVAYTIEITRPVRLIRTFLLIAANNLHALTWLARRATNIWLIPKALASPDPSQPAAVSTADFYDSALPLGETLQASDTIAAVLQHAGHAAT